MKLSISARDEERCDGVVERPVDDSVHGRLETSEYSTSLDGVAGDAAVSNQAIADVVNETMTSWAPVAKNSHSHSSI